MIHRGKIFDRLVRNSEKSITYLAERLEISQRHFYNLIKDKDLPLDWFIKLSKVTGKDYSDEVPELKSIDTSMLVFNESGAQYETNYKNCIEEREQLRKDKNALIEKNHDIMERYIFLLESKTKEYLKLLEQQSG